MSYIRIITFGEFEEIADKYNLIFPEKYWEITDSTLGIIKDKTFYEIEISNKAKEILFQNINSQFKDCDPQVNCKIEGE